MTELTELIEPALAPVFLGNTVGRWLLALTIVAAVLAAVAVWRWVVHRRVLRIPLRTETFLDDVGAIIFETTAAPIAVMLAFYAGSLVLNVPPEARVGLRSLAIILFLLQLALWGRALISRWVERYTTTNRETNAAATGTARLLGILARFGLYSLILLLILDNVPGVEVTALVASLGIGGVAVALATQNILGDIFASLSIAFDKPFVVGDFITVGEESGTVEQIGIKTTRMRSISGEQISLPNGNLVASRIRNFSRMEQRRVVFTFRVPYDTPPERLRAISALARELVEAQADTRFDRAHLLRFDDLGLVFEVVYFVLVPDFMRFTDIQQAVNLGLIEGLAAMDVSFAFLAEVNPVDRRGPRANPS
jgi:small-conductance mechanosensitive channel